MAHADDLAEVLFEVLRHAPDKDLAALKAALDALKAKPGSYIAVRRQVSAAALIDAIDEAIRYNAEPGVQPAPAAAALVSEAAELLEKHGDYTLGDL